MSKLKAFVEKFYVEYFVLISLFICLIGFTANYYTVRFTGLTIRLNMLLDFYETRWLGALLFILVCGGHVLVLLTIVKERLYSPKARKYFLVTLGLMAGVFVVKLLFMLFDDGYLIYNSETSWGMTTTQHFGFAMILLLVFIPILIIIAFIHPGYTGDGEKTLLGHIAKQYHNQDEE